MNILQQTQHKAIQLSTVQKNMQTIIHNLRRKDKAKQRWEKIEQMRLDRLEHLD